MSNTFLMIIDTPYTLNFLIYLQNIYFNQKQSGEPYNFPYMEGKVLFNDDFEMKFKELWEHILIKISEDESNGIDLEIFNEEKILFYEKLFIPSSENFKTYNEIYTSFDVWWSSYAGAFSIERAMDNPSYNLYLKLSSFLKGNKIVPKKTLKISLIYNNCNFSNAKVYPYFAILSIIDILGDQKEMILKLQSCFS